MNHEPSVWVGGGALFVAAIVAAAIATRVLLQPTPHTRSALPGLLWLLTTTALAVTGAALWASPGHSLGHTWPFAVALVIAIAPLVVASSQRRHLRAPQNVMDSGRRPPQ